MNHQEIHENDQPPNSGEPSNGEVAAPERSSPRTKRKKLFLPMIASMVMIVLVVFNNQIARSSFCLSLSIQSTLEKNDRWPPLPLWARYYFHAYLARTNEDAVFLFEQAISELRRHKIGDYWIARVLHEKVSFERPLGREREADLRESLVKFLATRGPRDSRATRYWFALGQFYEAIRRDYVRARKCYERSLVSAFVSHSDPQSQHLNLEQLQSNISRIHALAGNTQLSRIIDKQDLAESDIESLVTVDEAEFREDFCQMPTWPLPHRLYSPVTKCWGMLHDSPKEIDALYQSVLKSRAEQIRSESPEGATIMNRYAGYLRRQGRIDEAAKLDRKVIEIRDRQPKPLYLPANWKQLADDTSLP